MRATTLVLRSFPVLTAFALLTVPASAAVLRVDINAPGTTEDGTTWATAYTTVGAALSASAANDELWIADGVYLENLTLPSNRSLYGGFEGFGGAEETLVTQRSRFANRSIIDGSGAASPVLSGSGLSNALLDTLYVRGGTSADGGGIFVSNAAGAVTIRDCTIYQNVATVAGGGIAVNGGAGAVLIEGCIVIENEGGAGDPADGAGISFDGGGGSRTITRTYLLGNFEGNDGGALNFVGVTATVTNCLIAQNFATDDGAAVHSENSNVTFENVTFADNFDDGTDNVTGTIYVRNGTSPIVRNCIFARDTGYGIHDAGSRAGQAGATMENNLFFQMGLGLYGDRAGTGNGTNYANGDVATMNAARAEFSGNIEGNPIFRQDQPGNLTGTWEAVNYNSTTGVTTLTDNQTVFPAGTFSFSRFVDTNIASDAGMGLVVASGGNTLTVIGNFTGQVSPGDTYEIVSYPIFDSASPAVDAGLLSGASLDVFGDVRNVDLLPGPGITDIGAYEVQNTGTLLANVSLFEAVNAEVGQPVELRWVTDLEISNAGFNLLRRRNGGPFELVNTSLIPGQGDDFDGAEYFFTDSVVLAPAEVRSYVLIDVDFEGTETTHPALTLGPVAALGASVLNWDAYQGF